MEKPCVRCGHCCLQGMCTLGEPDEFKVCIFLVEDEGRTYKCIHPDAVEMFGTGCGSTLFNTMRMAVIRSKRRKD